MLQKLLLTCLKATTIAAAALTIALIVLVEI